MEIILLLGYVPLVVWLFSQSVMLGKLDRLAREQAEEIKRLKPFQFGVATLRGSDSPHAAKPSMSNVGGGVYNSIIKKEGN